MRSLYLTGNVAVSMVREGIKIRTGDEARVWSPPYFPYDTILIENGYGYVSFAALRILLSLRASVAVLDYQGRLLGHMSPYSRRSGDIQTKQFRAVNDPKKRLRIARSIATTGYRRRGLNPPFSAADNPLELIRMESHVADSYWERWSERLAAGWPENDFDGRKHPRYGTRMRAVSRVNATLNYAYTLLQSACRTTCHRVGLSPLHGFLHLSQIHDAEPLVYDLEELGRGWVDGAVLEWLSEPGNRKGFSRRDGWVVRLKPESVRSLVAFVSPRIRDEILLRDARSIVKRL